MKFCSNCGTKIEDGARFCAECGTKIEEVAKPEESAKVEEPVVASTPEQEEAPEASAPEQEETPEASAPEQEEAPTPSAPIQEEAPTPSEPEQEETPEASAPEQEETPEASEPEQEETPEASAPEQEETPEASEPEQEEAPEASAPEQEEAPTPSAPIQEEAPTPSAPIQEETPVVSPIPQENQQVMSQGTKKGLIAIVAIAAVAVVVIGVLCANVLFAGYKAPVKNLAKALDKQDSDPIEDYVLKIQEEACDYIGVDLDEYYCLSVVNGNEDYQIKNIESAEYKIVDKRELSEKKLKAIKKNIKNMKKQLDVKCSTNVEKGYIMEVDFTLDNDDDKKTFTTVVTTIKVDGDWFLYDVVNADMEKDNSDNKEE